MTVQYRLNGTLLSNRVELLEGSDGFTTAAERGALGTCGVRIEDLDASLNVQAWMSFTVDDTDATPTRVWTGVVGDRDIGRLDVSYVGASRVWDVDLYDVNYLLQWRIPRDNDGKRPYESDVVRVAWLLTNRALSGLVSDEGLVSTLNPINFFEGDCRRLYPNAILTEMAGVAGKNFFVYHDTTSGNEALFWDQDAASVWAATISITNSAPNGTTSFPPSQDLIARREGNDVYGAVSFGWVGGDPVYVESATINAAYFPTTGPRDEVYDSERVGRLTTALQVAKDRLNQRATEPDTITVRLRLPSSAVNKALAGQEIDVTLTHVPRYETGLTGRIRRRTATPSGPGFWDVELEIWVPPTAVSDADVPAASCSYISESNPGSNSSLDVWGAYVSNVHTYVASGTPPTPTQTVSGTGFTYGSPTLFGTANNGSSFGINSGVFGDPGTVEARWAFDLGSATSVCTAQMVRPQANMRLAYSDDGASWTDSVDLSSGNATVVSESAHRYWSLHYGPNSIGVPGLYYYSGSVCDGLLLWAGSGGEIALPITGTTIDADTGTITPNGSTTTGTTTYPYIAGTLEIKIDGQWLLAADYTETDPATGDYTLAFAPESDETVEPRYRAR